MSRALVIGPVQRAAIVKLVLKAAANPTPLATVKRWAEARERTGMATNPLHEDFTIEIPQGFKVTYTEEEQPGAVCRHISVSLVDSSTHGPHPTAIGMLLQAFGFKHGLDELPWFLSKRDDGGLIVEAIEPVDGNLDKIRRKQ